MQLTDAVRRSDPVHGHGLLTARPILPSPSIRKIMTDKTLTPGAGHENHCAPCTPSRQDSFPASPVIVPEMPDTGGSACGAAPVVKSHPAPPPKVLRPRSASVSRRISKSCPFVEQDIPLYLVPHIIARAIWQRGELTFRISVIRTKRHYYTIRLRTARLPARKGTKHCTHDGSVENRQACPEQ